jgi:hypothetical protein
LFLPALSASCLAQDITVRLVDVRTGHAFVNETLSFQFHIPQVPQLQILEQKTETDGAASFTCPNPRL